MNWDQFLENNLYNLGTDKTAEELIEEGIIDEDHYDMTIHMADLIDDLKQSLNANAESPEDIIYIEQEEPGDFFEAWTKYRVYFSYEDDSYDKTVLNAFRHPPYVQVK